MEHLKTIQAQYDLLGKWRRRWLALSNDGERLSRRWPGQNKAVYAFQRAERASAAIDELLQRFWASNTHDHTAGLPQPYQAAVDRAVLKTTLPLDASEEELRATVRSLRQHFEHRTEYNAMVADMLATRGVAPNGANVLATGGWGNSSSAAADIKLWYAGLAARLSAGHAQIPDAARRTANGLIEQLWGLALQCTQQPLVALSNDLEATKNQASHAEHGRQDAIAQVERLTLAMDQQASDAAARESELKDQIATRQREIDGLYNQVTELRDSIAKEALQHHQALQRLKDDHHQVIQRLTAEQQRAASEVKIAHEQALSTLQSKLDGARYEVNDKIQQIDDLRRQQMLTLDSYRQDIKLATARADKAQQETERVRGLLDDVRAQLASATVEKALLEQRLATMASHGHATTGVPPTDPGT